MRRVSDIGATAPITALTNAFILSSLRGLKADELRLEFIAGQPDEPSVDLRQSGREPACQASSCGQNRSMVVLAIASAAVVIALAAALVWRRFGRARSHDTALDEMRGMKEALKPAEHSRIERRRSRDIDLFEGQERRNPRKRR